MMQNKITKIVVLMMVLSLFGSLTVFGVTNNKYSNQILPSANLSRTLKGAITFDLKTDIVMYSNGVDDQHYLDGGLHRLMAVYTAYNAIRNDASKSYDITEFELEELCVRLIYNNDAENAGKELARVVSGSESEFVGLMNSTAKALGMSSTKYENCTAARSAGQYTTVHDQTLFAEACYNSEFVREIIKGSVYYIDENQSYSRNIEIMDSGNTKYYDKRVTHYITSDYSSEGYFMLTFSNVNQTNASGRVVATCIYQSGAGDFYAGMTDTKILNNNSFSDYYWVTLVDLAKETCQKTPFKLEDGNLAYCAVELKGNDTGITTISRNYYEILQENYKDCVVRLSSAVPEDQIKPGEVLGLGELYYGNDLLLTFDLRVVRIVSDDGKMISSDYSLFEPDNYIEQTEKQYNVFEFVPYAILVVVLAFAGIAAARYVRQKWMI